MAGDVTVAVVSGALAFGAGGTADFTKSGFGTPKACIVLVTDDTTDNTSVENRSVVSIGFSDFSGQFCITHQDEDNSAKVDCDALKSNTTCFNILGTTGSILFSGTASAITDGVRLTTSTGSAQSRFATIIMFGGADLADDLRSTGINSSQDGTATITHAGLTDGNEKLIFFIGVDAAGEDSSLTGVNNSFGVCHITGNDAGGYTFVQRCIGWASDHNATIGTPSAILSTDRVLDIITEAGGQDWGLEVTAFSSSGGTITVTTRDAGAGAGMEVYSLIVDLDDRKAKVGSVDGPTSGATWDPTVSLTFTPQIVGLLLTDLTNEDTITSDAEAGVMGISSNSGAGEETCHSWYNEDAIGTTNTNNLFRSRAIDLRDDDVTTVLQDHSHSAFDSTGWTYTINTENETVEKKWGFWTIEEATVPSNDQTLTATATGVAAIQLAVAKTLAVTAVANAGMSRKCFIPLSETAVGIATLATLRTAFVTATAVATGVVNLARKVKISLSPAVLGVANLSRKIFKTLNVSATGIAALVDILTLLVILAATATGIAGLLKKAKLGLTALATGVATINTLPTFRQILAATAIAIVSVQLKTKKALAVTATIVATISESVVFNGKQTLTAIATGIVAAGRKIKISLR